MNILIKFKNLLVESLKDNKKLIIGLYVLFIICFIAAWILSGSAMESIVNNLTSSANASPVQNVGGEDVIGIFVNNVRGGLFTYVASIFFAISAFVMLVYNAVNLGSIGQLFAHYMPNGGLRYIVYLIPHGIFEITATVLESVAGILLFLFIWRFIRAWASSETQGASEAFEKTKKVLVQSIVILIFSIILLVIAAPIETYISIPLSEFILGV